jgi:hypothetical protein
MERTLSSCVSRQIETNKGLRVGLCLPTIIDCPQFEMQRFWPVSVQKSGVVPHWPQISQHTFKGQGFRFAKVSRVILLPLGAVVFGFCGPHIALEMGAGIGGDLS